MTDSYKLVDVINALRTDIDVAVEAAKDKTTYFELGEIEVELTTQITENRTGEGGLNVGVVKIGGSGTDSNSNTQKIKLKLLPMKDDAKGQSQRKSNKQYISGKSRRSTKTD